MEKTLRLVEIEGKRRSGWPRMRWLDRAMNAMNKNFSKLQDTVEDREAWSAMVHGLMKSWA